MRLSNKTDACATLVDSCVQLVLKLNVFYRECVPLVASRGLGLAITAGSMLLFVPQILKIARAGSAEGISLVAMILGLIPALGTVAYTLELKTNLRKEVCLNVSFQNI
uniref:Uncharacterized protein n=1 Tax=Panagrolaimus sp. JU765 TaxID=591449 RepID=A0AC34RDG5_9BILA